MKLFSLKRIFLVSNMGLLFFFSVNAYALRCGTTLVNEGDSIEQVTKACGEPEQKKEWSITQCNFGKNIKNDQNPSCVMTVIPMADFTYPTPTGSSHNILHFANGKLVSIDFEL